MVQNVQELEHISVVCKFKDIFKNKCNIETKSNSGEAAMYKKPPKPRIN